MKIDWDAMPLYTLIFGLFIIVCLPPIKFYHDYRNNNISHALDIQESRKREDLLMQEVKLLAYQVDVLSTKENK